MNDRPDPLPDVLTELLADHDAGLPVDPSVLTGPQARSVLHALATTRAELAAVRREPVPPEFAGRWNAVLAEAARPGVPRSGPDRAGEAGRSGQPARPPCSQPPDARSVASAPAPRAAGPDAGGPAGTDGRRPTAGLDVDPSRPGPGTASPAGAEGRNPTPGPVHPGPPVRPAGRPGAGLPRPGRGARPGDPSRPVGPAGPHRPGRGRMPRPAVLAGLVLVVVLVVAGVVGVRRDPPSVTAAQLGGVARAAVGVQEAGPLTDPVRREACLRAVAAPGLAPDAPLAGGRSVVFEGRPGILLLLITGRLATFRVVVVTPGCDSLLADTVVGP